MEVVEFGRFGSLEVSQLTVGPWRANCYLMRASGTAWLVDPGDEAESLYDHIARLGVAVEHIILTHAHFDHVGAAHALAKKFGATCHLHPADAKLLKVANAYAVKFGQARFELPQTPMQLADQERLYLEDELFVVQHLPGHTAGGIALLGAKLAFSGDTLLAGKLGRTDLPGGDPSAISQSVSGFLEAISDECLICPGHGKAWSASAAKGWWYEQTGDKA